jgi:hypothetical protein
MTYQKTLLTQLKAAPGVGSTSEAARLLGVTRGQLYHVQNDASNFSDGVILKMAQLLSLDTVETLCRVHMESGNCPETRHFWKQVLAEHRRLQEFENKGKKRGKAA